MYILFDIGGSKMRIAASKSGKKIDAIEIVKTPKNFQEGIALFKKTALKLSSGKKIKLVVGGIRGVLNQDKSKIKDKILKNWSNKPLKSSLEKALKTKVAIENDSALVGLGEAVYGSGKKKNIVAYITISSGVGGVRIVNHKIDSGYLNSEPGLQIIDFKNKTPLENIISGTAVSKKYHKKPYEILDEKFWDKMAEILAFGLINTIVHWSPEVIVLGGSMMKKIGIHVPRVKYHLNKINKIYPKLPEIKKAALGDFGGLYGALARIHQE